MTFIEKALEVVQERDSEIANLHAIPVSLVGQSFSFSKGCKEAETAWFNPIENQKKDEQARQIFDPNAAATLLELIKEGKTPGWILERLNLDMVRRSARQI